MAKIQQTPKNYAKIGIIAGVVIVVAALGIWGVRSLTGGHASIENSIASVSSDAITGADLRMAVVRMDAIQSGARVLEDLRKQKESYESKLRDQLTSEQKALEKEKADIEKSQDVLSREALQRRVADYQTRVSKLQRDVAEKAQAVETSFQKALMEIQQKHLDPIIEGIIEKKDLSMVIDGRFARVSKNADKNLDITNDVIGALDKRISNFKMEKPKGM